MADVEGVSVKSTGIELRDDQQSRIAKVFLDTSRQQDQEYIAKLTPAKLTEAETRRLQSTETAAKDYLTRKLHRLGMATDTIHFPSVRYIAPQEEDKRSKILRFGYHGGLFVVCVIVDHPSRGDLFNASLATIHELSHASTAKEARLYWKGQEGKPTIEHKSISRGLSITGGGGEALGVGLENGLAICDEVDFCNTCLKDSYPEEYQKHMKWVERVKERREYTKLSNSIYGPIPSDILIPFVFSQSPSLTVLKQIEVPVLKDDLLKNYMLIRKLSVLIGKNIATNKEEGLSEDELFQMGRDYLDRNRYARTNDAHRKIVEIMGVKAARAIFHVGDGGENIDEAMQYIVAKENEEKFIKQ